jgi:phage terminase small subunit
MLDKPLRNVRWELFAQGVAKGASATQAYIDAGYKAEAHSAGTLSSQLLTCGDAARIEALKAKLVERVVEKTAITMADIVAGLTTIGFAGMGDFFRVSALEQSEAPTPRGHIAARGRKCQRLRGVSHPRPVSD